MQRSFVAWVAVCAVSAALSAQDESFPYVAYVNGNQATVHSGPGQVHYATDTLEHGAKVDVYRHDPGGWCAVRPPEGSFSLVPFDQLRMTETAGVAEVLEQDVTPWVGATTVTADDPMWQVRLSVGELLEVLGVKQASLAPGSPPTKFYKVAPPAGEFRWIHQRHLVRDLAELESPSREPEVTQTTFSDDTDETTPASRWRKKSGRPAAISTQAPQRTTETVFVERTTQPAADAIEVGEQDVTTQLDAIDIQLALILANEADTSELPTLRRQLNDITATGSGAPHSARTKQLLAKADEIGAFIRRRDAGSGASSESRQARTDAQATEAAPVGTGVRQVAFTADVDPRFDGTGWLMPVHTRRRDVPSYALTDDDGNVLQYVTSAPGLHIHRYREQKVGIYGQRGFVEHLQKPHVTAQRVVVLDKGR